jgi:hypothetical protein
MKMRLEHL